MLHRLKSNNISIMRNPLYIEHHVSIATSVLLFENEDNISNSRKKPETVTRLNMFHEKNYDSFKVKTTYSVRESNPALARVKRLY